MAASKEPIILKESIFNAEGLQLLPEGMSITKTTLADMPPNANAKAGLFEKTPFYKDMLTLPQEEEYKIALENQEHRDKVLNIIRTIKIPVLVAHELVELRKKSAIVYHHTLATTLLVTRAMFEVAESAEDIQRVARANLVKDLGMSRLSKDILRNKDHLTKQEYAAIKRHPITSMVLAYHYFGEGLESMVALRHHERRGKGYPAVAADKPNQVVDLVCTVDIFNALVSARSFRRESFDVRGAIDELKEMGDNGELPSWGAKLIATLYRTDKVSLSDIELSDKKLGFVPRTNHYGLAQ